MTTDPTPIPRHLDLTGTWDALTQDRADVAVMTAEIRARAASQAAHRLRVTADTADRVADIGVAELTELQNQITRHRPDLRVALDDADPKEPAPRAAGAPRAMTPDAPQDTAPATPTTPESPADIVTICGSMRFFPQMLQAAAELTAQGHIVLAPFAVVAPEDQDGEHKSMLDRLHLQKIGMSSRVVVVTDQDGYIGESTRREMAYAAMAGKGVDIREFTVPR
jgi:hypothetical protein